MSVVEDVQDEFEDVAPFLMDEYGVEQSDIQGEVPGITTKEAIVQRYGTDPVDDAPISYSPDLNALVVNEDTLGEGTAFEVSPSLIGEEVAHWLRAKVGDHYPYDKENLGTGNVSVRDHWKSESVMEMIGRHAAINCSAEFGGELDELDYGEWIVPQRFSSESASDIRNFYWDQSFRELNNTDWHRAFADRVSHEAGFTAGEEQYMELAEDERLMQRPTGDLWQEYDLNSYELDAIRDIKEEGTYESM